MLSRADGALLHALQQRKARDSHGLFLAEGIRVVEELLTAGYDLRFAVAAASVEDSVRGAALLAAIAGRTTLHRVPDHELKKLAATDRPQGLMVVAHIPGSELSQVPVTDRAVVLLADAVQDPGNLGTLIRTADAFAANCVLALPGTVDLWNPKTVRASAGSSFHLPLVSATHEQASEWLVAHRFQVLGAEVSGLSITEVALGARVALIAGNEGAGLSAATGQLVAEKVSIEMPGRAESLNVAVAAGILMHVISRR